MSRTLHAKDQTTLAKHDFIKGWGNEDTPLSSDQLVQSVCPHSGNMKPHSVAVHPGPKLRRGGGVAKPPGGRRAVEPKVEHAHVGYGNGVTWSLECDAERIGTVGGRHGPGEQGSEKIGPIDGLRLPKR